MFWLGFIIGAYTTIIAEFIALIVYYYREDKK